MTSHAGPSRPEPGEYREYYGKYIALVPDGNIIAMLSTQARETAALLRSLRPEQANVGYAPGKWTIKQVVGHIADAERVFAYRMLRIARADSTPLPGFEENDYAQTGGHNDRTLESIIAEFEATRAATIALIAGIPQDAWTRRTVVNDTPITARALAYIIAGHELHHRRIIEERYLALPAS